MASSYKKVLTLDTIYTGVLKAQYAVRGPIVNLADKIANELKTGARKFPFDTITHLNIGNPQVFDQKPISFFREVIAASWCPALLDDPFLSKDARNRAKYYLDAYGSLGSYTGSCGNKVIQTAVADFLQRRDGFPADPNCIVSTNGASMGIHLIMQQLASHEHVGYMCPVPVYPLYPAAVDLLGAKFVGYYLNEEKGWQVSREELERSHQEAVANGVEPRSIVIINPGNPTGQILDENSIKEVIKFAHEKRLVILADEVYQENVWAPGKKFHSFKKVLRSMPDPICNDVELASFHSTSKGFLGECGVRGGFMELVNFDQTAYDMIIKTQSINLCSNTTGQLMVDMMCNPPSQHTNESQETVQQYEHEKTELLQSLKRRADKCYEVINSMDNVSCNNTEGALYAFAKVDLPKKFIQEAKEKNMEPDFYYCLQVLENTGSVLVPGSGFGQYPGTHHFRSTILPLPEERFTKVYNDFKIFNNKLHRDYA